MSVHNIHFITLLFPFLYQSMKEKKKKICTCFSKSSHFDSKSLESFSFVHISLVASNNLFIGISTCKNSMNENEIEKKKIKILQKITRISVNDKRECFSLDLLMSLIYH